MNVNVIHNTYEDRNFHDATTNHAGFNGRGGIEARPDAAQQAAARGNHIGTTVSQTTAFRQATTTGNHLSDARTAGRNRGTGVTPDGRTTDLRTNPQITHNAGTSTRNTHSSGGSTRTALTRSGGGGRSHTNYTRGGGHSRGPKPQVAHQSKGSQSHGGGGGNKGKKH